VYVAVVAGIDVVAVDVIVVVASGGGGGSSSSGGRRASGGIAIGALAHAPALWRSLAIIRTPLSRLV
jgi:hypothetical protein